MLNTAWFTTKRALSDRGTWTVLVWSIGFTLLLVGILAAAGASSILSTMLHPQIGLTSPLPPSALRPMLTGILALYLVLLLAGPFFIAGIYGLFGQAVSNQTVSWATFWVMGKKLYGRAWGLYLYMLIYGVALAIVGTVFIAFLHIVGLVITIFAVIASLPWLLRMTGGLFVDQYTWGYCFSQSFHRNRYLPLLGTMLLTLLVYGVLAFMAGTLPRVMGIPGLILYFGIEMVIGVVGPVWFFALYRTAQES